MEKRNLNNYDFNGLTTSPNSLRNDISAINFSPNNNNKSSDINSNNFEENTNQINLPLPYFELKLRNSTQNLIPINSLPNKANEEILRNNKNELNNQKNNNNFDDILENGINLEEQNLKDYYSKIENELTKLKNENKEDINDNNNNIKRINSHLEGDLFYYSEEEDNNKKIKDIKENINILKNNLNKDINKNKNKDIKKIDKNIIEKEEKIEKDITQNLSSDIQIDKDLFDKIEYGIDENGNPFYVKNNDEELFEKNTKGENKKPVAFIIQQKEKGKNYLIDRKGKIIEKIKDGDFYYKNENIHILIKDFDVQHPELRVYGARKKDTLIINDENEESCSNHRSIEINNSNNSQDRLLHYNTNLNISKRKNILSDNFCDDKYLKLNNNLLKFKLEPVSISNKHLKNNKLISKNNQFNICKNKENRKTYDGRKFIFDKKRRELLYRKINSRELTNDITINNYQKINKLDTIRRTNNILNKSISGLYTNRSYRKNINLNKSDIDKKIEINNSFYNNDKEKNINYSQEIKNITCTTSKINLYKNKTINRNEENSSNNYGKIANLKGIIKGNQNNKNVNNLLNSNKEKDNNIDIHDNKMENKYKIIKSQSCKYYISTIDKISNNIKYIKNKLEKNLIKLSNNEASKNNNENINKTMPISTISTYNLQDNKSKEIFSYSNINNLNDKKNMHKFKNIELNKNNNIIKKNLNVQY